jgi:hypothetical protein
MSQVMTFEQFALWYFYCSLLRWVALFAFKVVMKLLRSP